MTAFGEAAEHDGALPLEGFDELTGDYVELARFWVSDTRSFTIVAADRGSPALLGSMLVECVQSAADGYAAAGGMTRTQALAELWKGFDEERVRLQQEEQD